MEIGTQFRQLSVCFWQMDFKEIFFNVIRKYILLCIAHVVSNIAGTPPPFIFLALRSRSLLSFRISELVIDLSNFDWEIPITAKLLSLAIFLNSSVLGNILLIFKWRDKNLSFCENPITSYLIVDAYKRVLDFNLYYLKV